MDVSASSRLAEELEAEHFAEILAALRDICRAVVQRHGGRIARIQGDGALALFGYPVPGEDDGRRAAEAALDVHAKFAQVESAGLPSALTPLQMHSGIHCGLALVSEGDVERGRFEVIGDAPNTAARLAALAPAGVIFADEESLGPHANFFELEPVGTLVLPGRSTPISTVRVLARADVKRRFDATARRGLTPFIGRQGTLAAVADLLQATATGPLTRRVFICGEAGIGKTRLLEEIAQLPAATAFQCLRGYCENYLGAEVLQPFAQMGRALTTPREPSDVGAPHGQRASFAAELLDVLAAFAASRPVLLLIDDWQWADDASRQLLEALLKAGRQMLVVLATRPMPDGSEALSGAIRFDLVPFSESETSRTVGRWLPAADPFVVAEIHRYAGGVPLFIEELCHSVSSRAPLRPALGKAGTSAWLTSLVASRLNRLPAPQQHIVRVAAVLGSLFPKAWLQRVDALRGEELDLSALAEADFVYPVDSGAMLRFKHGLTRDAVYETVGLRERVAIHLQVVSMLSTQDGAWLRAETLEALAYHAHAAGLGAAAARYAELAGDKANSAFALDRARALYLSAMDSLDGRADMAREEVLRWCSIAHKLGMTCTFDPLALPDALPIFERCLELSRKAGDAAITARSQYWLGYVCYVLGHPRKAALHCREALRSATLIEDRRLMAQVEATLGQALGASSDYDEALVLMDRALNAKRQGIRTGSSIAVGSVFTLACKGGVLGDRGEFDAAHTCFDQAMALLGDSTHPVANSVRNWAVMVLLWQGRWKDAQRVADESLRSAESSRALLPLAISRAAGGYARWMGTGSVEGFEQIIEAVQWMEQRRGQFFTSIFYGWLVEGCVALKRYSEARRHAAKLFQRSRAGELLGETVGCRALALAGLDASEIQRADRYLQQAQASAFRRGSRREKALNDLCLAQMLHRKGRAVESAGAARMAIDEFHAMGMEWHASTAVTWA